MKIYSVLLFFFIVLLVNVRCNSQNSGLQQLKCLVQKNVSEQCIHNLDTQKLIKNNIQATVYICPVLIKFYEENHNSRQELYEKIQSLCRMSTQVNRDNGYLLLGLYLMNNQYIKAIQLEYNLFFSQPFDHEEKLKQIITHYDKIEKIQRQQSQAKEQLRQLNKGIKALYENKIAQALLTIDKLYKQQKLVQKQLRQLILFLKVRIMQRNNQFPQALSVINQAINKNNKEVHWYLYHLKGNLLMHHIKFKEAILAFQISVKLKNTKQHPFAFSLYNIGLCYQKINEYKKSINYLRKVINIKPDCAEALNSLGFTYSSLIGSSSEVQNKEYVKLADNYYRKSIMSNEKYFVSYYNYGMLKFQIKQYDKAAELFQKSLKLNNNISNISSKYGLFKSLYKINRDSGLKYLEQNILTFKDHIFYDIGLLFYQLGENKIAKEYLQKALNQKYNLGQVYEWKGLIQFQMEDYDNAEFSFRKALENGNTKSSIWFNLGYLSELKQNYQKALGLYKKCLEKDPNGPAKQRLKEIQKLIKQKNKKQQL